MKRWRDGPQPLREIEKGDRLEVAVVLLSVGIRLRIRPQPPALSNTKIQILAGT